jgi:hypothetical protein
MTIAFHLAQSHLEKRCAKRRLDWRQGLRLPASNAKLQCWELLGFSRKKLLAFDLLQASNLMLQKGINYRLLSTGCRESHDPRIDCARASVRPPVSFGTFETEVSNEF